MPNQWEQRNQGGTNFQNENPTGQVYQAETIHIHNTPSIDTNPSETKLRSTNIPTLPEHFLTRNNELDVLIEAILGNTTRSVAVTGKVQPQPQTGKVSIQGMGGIGKSVLATAVARDDRVQKAYSDGIFWVSLGQTPNLLALQADLAIDLGEANPEFSNLSQGKKAIQRLLANRDCLLVLDDIWEMAHFNAAFDALGERSQLLITTRDVSIANRLTGFQYSLEELTEQKALALLQQWTNVETLPPEAPEVARECGYLPLALAMVGAYLRDKSKRWERILDKLRSADLEQHKISKQLLPGYQYELFRAIQVSIEALEEIGELSAEEVQQRYFDFAVFPEDTPITEAVLETFWVHLGMDEDDIIDVLDELVDKSLLKRDDRERLTLHDLQYDYIRKRVEDSLPALNHRLVEAYAAICEEGWPSGPNDGYFFEHISQHFVLANRTEDLRKLLLDADWLLAKLKAVGVNSLIADYDSFKDDAVLGLVKSTLRLSSHVLSKQPEQLSERLWGHLVSEKNAEVESFLKKAAVKKTVWLKPKQANLDSPNGSLLRTLAGHTQRVEAVATLNGNTRAVSGSEDTTLKIWDLQTGDEVKSLYGHRLRIGAVSVTRDGKRAITASADKTLKLWDLETGHELMTLEGHNGRLRAVVIDKEGRRAVSGSDDKTLKVWDLGAQRELHTLTGHKGHVKALAMTIDEKHVISASVDKTLKVWDLASGAELKTFEGHSEMINAIAVTPNGKSVVSASADATLKIWNLETGRELRTLTGHTDQVRSAAITPDGKHIVSGSADETIKVWDLEMGCELKTFSGHSNWIDSVAITTDGSRLISASQDETLKIWDLESDTQSFQLASHASWISDLAFTESGEKAISTSWDKTLKVWDLKTGNEAKTLTGHRDRVNSVAISRSGKIAISGSNDKTLRVWSLETGQNLRTLSNHKRIRTVDITPDGKQAISTSLDRTLQVWDLETGSNTKTIVSQDDVFMSAIIINNGKRAISASKEQMLKVWDLSTGTLLQEFSGHRDIVRAVVVTKDEKQAISTSLDKTIRVWDLETGIELKSFTCYSDRTMTIVASTDGKRVVSASWDKTLEVWDLETGQRLAIFHGDCAFWACAISPDNKTVVAGGQGGAMHFFDLVDH